MRPFRIGVVGAGKIFEHHLRGIVHTKGVVEITYIAEPSVERREVAMQKIVSEGVGHPVGCAVLSEIPVDGCDALLLCIPHDLHESLCDEALKRGPCILEKPIARTLEEARRILRLAKRRGQLLFICENSAFWPEVITAKRLIDEGAIGELVAVHSHYYESLVHTPFGGSDVGRVPGDPYNMGWRASLERCGGGITIDGGLHWLRPLRIFAGEIESVIGATAKPFTKDSSAFEGESLSHAMLRFRDSEVQGTFKGTVMARTHMSKEEPWFRVIGSTGEITISADFAGGIRLYSAEHQQGSAVPIAGQDGEEDAKVKGFFGSFCMEWLEICACLERAGESRVSPATEAATDVAVVEAMYRSLRSDSWERVEAVGPICVGEDAPVRPAKQARVE